MDKSAPSFPLKVAKGHKIAGPPNAGLRHAGAAGDDHLADSLRSVYKSTLDETVPESMMDLLKKLG